MIDTEHCFFVFAWFTLFIVTGVVYSLRLMLAPLLRPYVDVVEYDEILYLQERRRTTSSTRMSSL